MKSRKDSLVNLQAELQHRISSIDEDIHSRDTSHKFSEQALERQNDDVLLNLKEEAQQELRQVEQALLKIKNNQYGNCAQCHKPISDKRLDAIPFASLCQHCAS